jgi:hypothetical protein
VIIAAVALRHGQNAVTISDIRTAFKDSRIPVPANLSEQIARAIRRGWLAKDSTSEDLAWHATAPGLRLAQELLREEEPTRG